MYVYIDKLGNTIRRINIKTMPITEFGAERMKRNLKARGRGRRVSITDNINVDKILTKWWVRLCIFVIYNFGFLQFLLHLHADEIDSSLSYIDILQHKLVTPTIVLGNFTFFMVLYFGNGFGSVDDIVDNQNNKEEDKEEISSPSNNNNNKTIKQRKKKRKSKMQTKRNPQQRK